MEIQYFDSLANTNTHLIDLSKKNAKSWTAVWTDNQTEGRGYSGNRWLSKPGDNIALSLLIVNHLNYEELVFFNQWIANSVRDALEKYTDSVFVKWPNDIILTDKKVCGILIETRRSGNDMFIVTGIGLNVNQTEFEYPKAGSLRLKTGLKYDLNQIVTDILTVIFENYDLIENKDWQKIADQYNSKLFRKDEISTFKKDEKIFEAVITGVGNDGNLIVRMADGKLKTFGHKEVELIY